MPSLIPKADSSFHFYPQPLDSCGPLSFALRVVEKMMPSRAHRRSRGNYKVIGPLGPTSMEILREFYEASKTDLVFSRSGNIAPKFYRILREACERAGVPYGRGTRDGLVLHDARHTATTHLLESNVSPKTVQEWMGWSDKAFVLYYSHASKGSREQAGRALELLAGKKTA